MQEWVLSYIEKGKCHTFSLYVPASIHPLGSVSLLSSSLSVRSATALQLAPTFAAQRRIRESYIAAAQRLDAAPPDLPPQTDALLCHLETSLASLWRIPWDNHNKETLWRLTVQGLSGGGGHDICP